MSDLPPPLELPPLECWEWADGAALTHLADLPRERDQREVVDLTQDLPLLQVEVHCGVCYNWWVDGAVCHQCRFPVCRDCWEVLAAQPQQLSCPGCRVPVQLLVDTEHGFLRGTQYPAADQEWDEDVDRNFQFPQ